MAKRPTDAELLALLAAHSPRTGFPCCIAVASPAARENFRRLIAMPPKQARGTAISVLMAELHKVKVSDQMVQRHRRGDCLTCGRSDAKKR